MKPSVLKYQRMLPTPDFDKLSLSGPRLILRRNILAPPQLAGDLIDGILYLRWVLIDLTDQLSGSDCLTRRWAISRSLLYTSSWAVCVILCAAWGIGLAYGLRLFILAMQPGLLLKLFGYPAVAYISVPNYGLVDERMIPESGMPRHIFFRSVPMTLYIVASVIFAFTVSQ